MVAATHEVVAHPRGDVGFGHFARGCQPEGLLPGVAGDYVQDEAVLAMAVISRWQRTWGQADRERDDTIIVDRAVIEKAERPRLARADLSFGPVVSHRLDVEVSHQVIAQ